MHAMQEEGSSHNHGHDATSGLNGYAEGNSTPQRKPKGPQMRDTLATMVGMLLPLLTQFGHHHH
jgi:zinc transporter 9